MHRYLCGLIVIALCICMVGCGHIKDSDTKNTKFSVMSEIEKREYVNKYLKQKYTDDTQCHDEISKKQTHRDYKTTAKCKQGSFDLWISPAGEITDTYFDIAAKKALTKNLSDIASSYFPSFNLFVTYKFDNYPEKIYRPSEWKEMYQNEIKRNSITEFTINLVLNKSDGYYTNDTPINKYLYDIGYLPAGKLNIYIVSDPKSVEEDNLPDKPYYSYGLTQEIPPVINPTEAETTS